MRFFMLSDFHLSESSAPETEERLKRLCSKIRSDIDTIEEILFVLMGDLIHKGNKDAFCLIDKMIALVRDELSDYIVNFEAIPGNHDLVNKSIQCFSACMTGQGISRISENCPVYARRYGEVNLIFTDSTLTKDYSTPGKLDLGKINSFIVPGKKNLLFSHHGFTQSHGDEHNVVEDGGEILKKLGDMGISFAFHAHTHRADAGSKIGEVIEIGCGSFSGDLTGMSGVTHQFTMGGVCPNGAVFVERWIDAKDGTKNFLYDSLYPETRHFTDPHMVGKLKYEVEEQYIITRHIMPHELSMQDEWTQHFSNEKEQDLFDILRKTNYLLLADAGQGKSVALRALANRLCDSTYFPLLFSLKNYTGKSIDELLPESYKGLNPSHLAILFDGYDELTNEMLPLFEANLNEFISKWPGVHVVLSSRSNFCKTEQTNKSITFPGFQVYDLCPLDGKDIEQYLTQQGIDANQFWTAVRISHVVPLCKNPFYLTRLAELFGREHSLPPKTKLMDKLIQNGFEIDNQKFPSTLEEIYQELFCSLERLAYAMQLLRKKPVG